MRSRIQITINYNEGRALESDLQLARLIYMVERGEGGILLNFSIPSSIPSRGTIKIDINFIEEMAYQNYLQGG